MKAFLDLNPERYGLSEAHCRDIRTVDTMLGSILKQHDEEGLTELAQTLFQQSEPVPPAELFTRIKKLQDPKLLQKILRAYTVLFQLLNLAEQKEIIRVNRIRQLNADEKPRSESILDTFTQLRQNGVSADSIQELLNRLDICPTLTAHPTEARRRAVLDKLETIAQILVDLNKADVVGELDEPLNYTQYLHDDLERQLTSLWFTEELNRTEITVKDERQNAMYFVEHTIFELVVWLYRDVKYALKKVYPEQEFTVPVFLRYRSWVGGDRDGNPNVTPEVTWQTLLYHKQKVLNIYIKRVNRLLRKYTQSERLITASRALWDSLKDDQQTLRLSSKLLERYQDEPYAQKLICIRAKLRSTLRHLDDLESMDSVGEYVSPPSSAYAQWQELLHDLELIQDSFLDSRVESLALDGSLGDLIIQVKTFGFHLASLDIRQHSSVHEEVLNEMFNAANRLPDDRPYQELSEEEKIEVLSNELSDPRPLLPRFWSGSDKAMNLLRVFEVIRHGQHIIAPESVQAYIISMTHSISDILEVLVLGKEAGLVRLNTNGGNQVIESDLDVVPLFETIDDLERSEGLMASLFNNPLYSKVLKGRGNFQEIMLGYSDSSKDGGYMTANWYLHDTQERLANVFNEHGIEMRLFHGRGGTVGRGGGRAYLAIRSQPPQSMNGKIRFTEQGEIISFRYSFSPIAHRHLEQIIGAVLLASTEEETVSVRDEWTGTMKVMADFSRTTYRSLIYDNDNFFPFFVEATPIRHISHLSIASRPVSRSGKKMSGLDDLRAIPWNFSWVQSRYLVPGWYGVGSAIEHFVGDSDKNLALLQEMYRQWNLFRLIVDNAKVELLRTHIPTAAWYASRTQSEEVRNQIHGAIETEFEKTHEWIYKIIGEEQQTHSSVVKRTIDLRNPIVAVLNQIQVALLMQSDRMSEDGNHDDERWRESILLSLTGIAAAMQSTG